MWAGAAHPGTELPGGGPRREGRPRGGGLADLTASSGPLSPYPAPIAGFCLLFQVSPDILGGGVPVEGLSANVLIRDRLGGSSLTNPKRQRGRPALTLRVGVHHERPRRSRIRM